MIEGKSVLVCGAAPCLREELRSIDAFEYVVLAADGATSVVLECGVLPDVIVSDLDGYLPDIIYASRLGAIVVAHAHGDNIGKIRRVLPELSRVLCTTQARPLPPHVHNFGGFTDGDRCVFLAKELGAASVKLVGFDFEDTKVNLTKRRKLKWAKRLIEQALRDC
ncbi:MAG: 6-hydroxymethyl-7 [Candidatus Alkanophagales archaeon MCA70_species_2]|nr:6-hydroxymethyl-7 [Candidatus Alkanophaga liquidiphilum]